MQYKPLPYLLLDDLKGHLYAAGHDAILMPLSVIEGIQNTLDRVLGKPADILVYRIGAQIGREHVAFLSAIFKETGVRVDRDVFIHEVFTGVSRSAGWGNFHIRTLELENHLVEIELSGVPTMRTLHKTDCYLERGLLAGAYQAVTGMELFFEVAELLGPESVLIRSSRQMPEFLLNEERMAVVTKRELEELIRERTEELRRSEERYRSIVDHATDAIVTYNSDGIISFWNPGAARLYGYTAGEAVGKPIRMLMPDEKVLNVLQSQHKEVLQGKVFRDVQTTRRRKDGTVVTVSLTLSPLKGADETIVGVTGITRDITDRVRLQAQLYQTEKLAALGNLVAGLVHELNNPLAGIMGYAELQTEAKDLDKAKGNASKILREADRMRRIIQNLLSFSRHHRSERSSTRINDVLHSVVDLSKNSLIKELIQVQLDLDPNLPAVWIDSHHFQQVFLNIITNARQAIAETGDGGMLTIQSTSHEGYIRIAFSDTGPGIPAENLPNIFNPFFTTRDVGQGTGLGLSQALGIVQEHDGHILVASEPGAGATFIVELPIVSSPEDKQDSPPDSK